LIAFYHSKLFINLSQTVDRILS